MFLNTTDNKSLYYEVHGNPSGEPLVFFNGLSQTTASWGLMLPYFANYKVILLDFIFQAKSDKEGPVRDFNQHAGDVLSLFNYLKITKAHIAGISYGSLVAQNFSVNYPDRIDKIILISTFAHKTQHFHAIEDAWLNTLDAGGFSLLVDVMLPTVLSDNFMNNLPFPFSAFKDTRLTSGITKEGLKKLMTATKERTDYREELKKIKAPGLVIYGDRDMLISEEMSRGVADNIAGSNHFILKGVGHTINLESPVKCAEAILGFLKS